MIIKRFGRKDDGSLTLEAALIVPIFMLFIMFLATLIRIAMADMAVYNAISDTNEMIVTHAYPVEKVTDGIEDMADEKLRGIHEELTLDVATDMLDKSLEILDIEFDPSSYIGGLSESILQPMVRDKFDEMVVSSFFNSDNLTIEVTPPGGFTGEEAFLKIDATYDLELSLPFVQKTLSIKKTSYERLWTGS